MIGRISQAGVAFKSNELNKDFKNEWDKIPTEVDAKYKTPKSRINMVTVCGDANDNLLLDKYINLCSEVTTELVEKERFNILTGCGTKGGIMKSAFYAALNASTKGAQGESLQNFVIVSEPGWGDELIWKKYCTPIGKFPDELRAKNFFEASDIGLFFPGGLSTDKEFMTWMRETINMLKSQPEEIKNQAKKIILVGSEIFTPLLPYLKAKFKNSLIDESPDKLVKILDTKEEIVSEVVNFRKTTLTRLNKII